MLTTAAFLTSYKSYSFSNVSIVSYLHAKNPSAELKGHRAPQWNEFEPIKGRFTETLWIKSDYNQCIMSNSTFGINRIRGRVADG